MNDNKQMQDMYERLMEYEQAQHEKNQQRIKVGIKLLWIVPIIFLILLFITNSSKVIFLTLWIVSLFGIAVYLIMVEYMDYNLQEKMHEINGEEHAKVETLLEVDAVEEKVIAASERIDERKEAREKEIAELKEKATAKVPRKKKKKVVETEEIEIVDLAEGGEEE